MGHFLTMDALPAAHPPQAGPAALAPGLGVGYQLSYDGVVTKRYLTDKRM